ncbi:Histidine kinase-, DNA gyrase B-, and HSP90-like ATPase [Amycolatopsis lurida]|uniref:Histidine kinase n=1 Tax=Amycolatopsis lurida NRRL 2430 TaxID=1460371 RepID=A0A2P2FZG6_AMYLU|nr:sensor histidine kinase [Amycolatopsis lurida]KFU82131.1 histidine kinase [Amycolatopsis lurida NRRL 2430]SEC46844.1 Histidine kinase-, DNA gyrase B-, and HSP90-like ATPase [Amycolatopsis lurida]
MRRTFVVTDVVHPSGYENRLKTVLNDLHDGLGPTLAVAVLGLRAARELLVRDRAGAERLLARLEEELHGAITELRRIVTDARPPALDETCLVTAVRRYAGMLADRVPAEHGPLGVTVEVRGELPPLAAEVEVTAYRIIREALVNIARHSGARQCAVRLWPLDGDLRVEIVDDGVGAGGEVLPAVGGTGLRSMRERAVDLGGGCVMEPVPSGGTRIAAWLPLATKE